MSKVQIKLVEKELLHTIAKKKKVKRKTQVLKKLNESKGNVKVSQQNQKILDA